MSDMFRNYPQPADYIPNNRPCCKPPFHLDIMSGETAVHTFEIPFNVEEGCDTVEVIYSLGIKPIIIKNNTELEITITECNSSIITCKLSEAETTMFANTLLDAKVQVKFYMKNGTTSYSEIYNIKLMNSLDANREKPVPPGQIIKGIGYTED